MQAQPPKTTLFGGGKEPGFCAAVAAPMNNLPAEKNPGSVRPVAHQ
jgi:hypothetical protein